MLDVVVLGATGSVGESTLDVIARHPNRYQVYALTANRSVDTMVTLCLRHRPTYAVMMDPEAAQLLASRLAEHCDTKVLDGEAAMEVVASAESVDIVMAAVVGFAGLRPALAAARSGKRLLLANKEALVSAGSVFMAAVREGGATLLPIDSEHNAMFQCLPANEQAQPQMQACDA